MSARKSRQSSVNRGLPTGYWTQCLVNTVTVEEYRRIGEFESRSLAADPNAKWHRLVKETERILKRARPDDKGIPNYLGSRHSARTRRPVFQSYVLTTPRLSDPPIKARQQPGRRHLDAGESAGNRAGRPLRLLPPKFG